MGKVGSGINFLNRSRSLVSLCVSLLGFTGLAEGPFADFSTVSAVEIGNANENQPQPAEGKNTILGGQETEVNQKDFENGETKKHEGEDSQALNPAVDTEDYQHCSGNSPNEGDPHLGCPGPVYEKLSVIAKGFVSLLRQPPDADDSACHYGGSEDAPLRHL